MFSFVTPLFLWAGVAAAIPLVLHLLQKRRIVRVPFSTIRFLKLADRQSSRRIRMEHFILWLLRTLLILLLVLAFAMPMLRTKGFGSFLGRAQRDVAIVIDTSYSMGYNTGRQTVWDKAVETVVAVLQGLSDQDRLCIFLADNDVTPLIEQLSGDRDAATGRIRNLWSGYTSSRLCPAVMAANAALEEETRRREREIHIITDNQALPWNSFGRAAAKAAPPGGRSAPDARWDPSAIADRTAFFVALLGVPAPENVAPLDTTLNPQLIIADMPARVDVRLTHSGPPQSTTASLYVDGRELARRSTLVGGDAPGNVTFSIPPLGPGRHAARVETPEDSLPADNRFHFLVRTRDKLPVLCVGSADDTLFLKTALGAGSQPASVIDVKTVEPQQLAEENLESYACVFLCNALPLPGQEIVRIEKYARSGGLLVIFPGDMARVEDYAVLSSLPGTPVAVSDVSVLNRKRILRWEKPRHPLLRTLKSGAGVPVVSVRRALVWESLSEDAEVLVTAGAEHPFLLCRPSGRGQVILLAVSADRTWSDFPLSPFYLPIVHQIVQFAAGVGGFGHYLWATQSLPLEEYLPEATIDSTLLGPDGKEIVLRSAVVEGKTILHAEDLTTPGVYTLSSPDRPEPRPVLAVNMQRAESNLTPIAPEDVAHVLRVKNVNLAHDTDDLLRQIEEHRVGKTFGEQLLWLALIVATIEFYYANMLLKTAPSLSETLKVASSGKVATR